MVTSNFTLLSENGIKRNICQLPTYFLSWTLYLSLYVRGHKEASTGETVPNSIAKLSIVESHTFTKVCALH
jgi:hypothetical protein